MWWQNCTSTLIYINSPKVVVYLGQTLLTKMRIIFGVNVKLAPLLYCKNASPFSTRIWFWTLFSPFLCPFIFTIKKCPLNKLELVSKAVKFVTSVITNSQNSTSPHVSNNVRDSRVRVKPTFGLSCVQTVALKWANSESWALVKDQNLVSGSKLRFSKLVQLH